MRILDHDPFTGVTTYFEHDPVTKKNIIQYSQDIEPLIEHNKRQAELLDKSKSWWTIGTVPNSLLLKWTQECGKPMYSKEWQQYALKQLDSAEYRKFNPNKVKLTR